MLPVVSRRVNGYYRISIFFFSVREPVCLFYVSKQVQHAASKVAKKTAGSLKEAFFRFIVLGLVGFRRGSILRWPICCLKCPNRNL